VAVIALTSASGSPGVTTTAVGLSLLWPRPVLLVEADPTGGSGLLSGFFRGTREYDSGLIELALSSYDITDALPGVVQTIEGSTAGFIAGTRSHVQSAGLRDLWQPLAGALADLDATGQDVIVDAGRLGLVGAPEPLLANADVSLLVTRTTLPALAAARSWSETVTKGAAWRDACVLLVGEGQPYSSKEVASVLGLPVVGAVADDRDSAAVYHRGATTPRRFDSGPMVRSLRAMIEAIQARIAGKRIELVEATR
jgi:hypothetical protein